MVFHLRKHKSPAWLLLNTFGMIFIAFRNHCMTNSQKDEELIDKDMHLMLWISCDGYQFRQSPDFLRIRVYISPWFQQHLVFLAQTRTPEIGTRQARDRRLLRKMDTGNTAGAEFHLILSQRSRLIGKQILHLGNFVGYSLIRRNR